MKIINSTKARNSLYRLIDETSTDHEPILITGKRNNAVIIGEEDWKVIQRLLHK